MGVATGSGGGGVEGGRVPPVRNSGVDVPPEIAIFEENFRNICQNLQNFQYFQIKVGEI